LTGLFVAKTRRHGLRGLTLLDVTTSTVILAILMTGILTGLLNSQQAFVEDQTAANLSLRAQRAMNRLVRVAGQALTNDAQFTPLNPVTGVDSHGLRFRLLQSVDPITGDPLYDDDAQVFIFGPNAGATPCAGLIIGRGPDLNQVYNTASGGDAVLGTNDDDTNVVLSGNWPAVELLLPSVFVPAVGTMLEIDFTPAPVGRLLTFTLRVNAPDPDGNGFVLQNDLVLVERVALRE
jgi:type II secretory pathway pseudopilin PulG